MIDQHQIMQMAAHVFRHANGRKSKRLLHPKREWAFGLTIGLVILVIGGWYASTTYLYYETVDASHGTAGSNIPLYKKSLIERTLTLYRDRAATYDKLANTGLVSSTNTTPTTPVTAQSTSTAATSTHTTATSTSAH